MRTVSNGCLDHMLIFRRGQLERVLREFVTHYNNQRPHRKIDLGVPTGRTAATHPSPFVHRHAELGSLIHEYYPVTAQTERCQWSGGGSPDCDIQLGTRIGDVAPRCPVNILESRDVRLLLIAVYPVVTVSMPWQSSQRQEGFRLGSSDLIEILVHFRHFRALTRQVRNRDR